MARQFFLILIFIFILIFFRVANGAVADELIVRPIDVFKKSFGYLEKHSIFFDKEGVIKEVCEITNQHCSLEGFEKALQLIFNGKDQKEILYRLIRRVLLRGDPYGNLYSQELYSQGEPAGWDGLEFNYQDEGPLVVCVWPEGEAAKAGIRPLDLILRVNGLDLKTAEDWDAGVSKDENGLRTYLLKRGHQVFEAKTKIKKKQIKREARALVTERTFNQVAYLKIFSFDLGVSEVAGEILQSFRGDYIKVLVLDLRDNGGGFVTESEGLIKVLTGAQERWPVYVLVNGKTASASERTALALQKKGGILIGQRTHGKGVAQNIFVLPDTSLMKFSSVYIQAGGQTPHLLGLEPDILYTPVELKWRIFENFSDPLLDFALKHIYERMSR